QLLDLEMTAAPPTGNGHDGRKLTKKKQLQQQHFVPAATTTKETAMETEATTTSSTTSSTSTSSTSSSSGGGLESSQAAALLPVPNGYLGPIFMGEKTFSVVHPLKKPQATTGTNHQQEQQQQQHEDSIELQLRQGRIVEILAPTALLESNVESSSTRPGPSTTTTTTMLPAAVPQTQSVLSTTVFQVPELQQSSTTRLPMPAAEISVAPAPPRTESKISDIQIEVYDSTVDSIVASTNFRDNRGYYPLPLEQTLGTARPPSSPVAQERFTQYVIDRADVSTQPAAGAVMGVGMDKPEPAAIEIHINVSEAFGNESEDLEFSYRQPAASETKANKPNDEILVVEIIDNSAGDNSTENTFSDGMEHMNLNPMFGYPYRSDAPPSPAVRPPHDSADELFMADTKSVEGLPRPPPPPPPPPPRKPNIDRDSDTIFYISNTEVKVGESLPTVSSAVNEQQQRKLQFENQFFPASYVLDQQQQQQLQRSSAATPRYEEDILLSPQQHTADALKILRSPSSSSSGGGGGDGAPPLDVTYVGESVIEVEQQSLASTMASHGSSQQPDIVIQPAVLPDLAIGVPVIGELPPQIELKEIDYMPGELVGAGRNIYENDIESNGLGLGNDPDVIESSIQYGGDLIDDGAGGGFDGVEGSYPFESPAHRLQQQDAQGSRRHPFGHGFSHLHREQLPAAELLNATLQQHNESLRGYADSSGASAMAPLQHGERMGNATALSEDPLADYDGFLNLFAVSMGLIIVILPAALLTSMYCAVRYLLNKNATSSAAGDDSEQGQDSKNESSSCSVASFSSPISQLSIQHVSLNPNPYSNPEPNPNPDSSRNPDLIRSMSLALASGVQRIEFQFEARPDIQTPTSTGAATPTLASAAFAFSGSVTKMTLKDNHLIVVTEERHDISRNARETKMHTDKDGVFVVEVARGIDSKQPPDSPAAGAGPGADITELPFDTNTKQTAALVERSLPPSHEQVQIHAPPSDFANPSLPVAVGAGVGTVGLQLIEEEQLLPEEEPAGDEEPQPMPSLTGLSQSDLSSSSSSDSNKRYSYGNQELYVIEQPGYAQDSPHLLSAQLIAGQETTDNDQEPQSQLEEPPVPAPAAFGNAPELSEALEEAEAGQESMPAETPQEQTREEPENGYDSLMSLPAPPSTEEIKELNDFTLNESNQLDSLPPPPPPPPPPPLNEASNGEEQQQEQQQEQEEEREQEQKTEPILKLANGKIIATNAPPTTTTPAAAANGGGQEPSTLTPPASPP
ncbi:uncharacterized protein Dvir_GJ15875, partial [Drosophila virilis]